MKTWVLNHWDRLRNSLWFVPATGLIIALAAALLFLQLDAVLRVEQVPALQWAVTTGPAARATLSTLAGALVTVTGLVFSITMLMLAQTTSLFGSRLLRSFLNHNVPQVTLALFLGTSVYCFAVLWAIREFDGGVIYVPHLSVGVGLLAGLVSFAAFISFIRYVSYSIQAQNVVRNVAQELNATIDRQFPQSLGEDHDEEPESPPVGDISDEMMIESTSDGYVQAVDVPSLIDIAAGADMVIHLQRRPGHFIASGTPIAAVVPQQQDDELAGQINACFLTGVGRTPRQDVECAILELVEVAVRALSPGINDPYTAIACIDYLGAALMQLSQRALPASVHTDADDRVRVVARPVTFGDALDAAFDEIRQHGRDSASVVIRMAETLQVVSRKVSRPADRDAILRQAAMLDRAAEDALPEQYDRADVRQRLRSVRDALDCDGESDDAAARAKQVAKQSPE